MFFEVGDEQALFVAVDALYEDDEILAGGVRFGDWPRFEVTIWGQAFEGGVPTRVMPALERVQRAVHRAYARSVYGNESARLTREDRQGIELVFELADGSTKIRADLAPVLNELASRLSGRASVALVLAIAVILKGDDYLKVYLEHRRELLRAGPVLEAVQVPETRDCLSTLAEESADVSRLQDDVDEAARGLLLSLEDEDQLVFDGRTGLRGRDARRLGRRPRRIGVRSTVQGEFMVQSVQSGRIRNGFRATIREVSSDEVLSVSISERVLTESQLQRLQRAEWQKRPVNMTIDVQQVGEQIVRAELMDLG